MSKEPLSHVSGSVNVLTQDSKAKQRYAGPFSSENVASAVLQSAYFPSYENVWISLRQSSAFRLPVVMDV